MKIRHQTSKLSDLTKIRERIHLNPVWQRGPVWSRPKQALLVDSILRGYDIPMIYLRETPPDTAFKYEVVDGQQRLRAIWEFIDGAYRLSDDLDPIGRTDVSGATYGELPASMRKRIEQFKIVVAYVQSAREPEISRLFSRMQMGVRLNPPELRNAVQTAVRHAIDGTAREHPFFKESRIQPTRFKRQDYLAHAFSICFHDGSVDLKAPQLMEDYETISEDAKYVPLMSDVNDVLDVLRIINQLTSKRLTQKWMFVDLFYLLYRNKSKLKKLRLQHVADTYATFDRERLHYNAAPEALLEDSPTAQDRQLYEYIQAFKISGGDQKNLSRRQRVLERRLRTVLR
ncbi:DUF262 domain-containing protein [Bradyrhizobium liaoningense]|uniref:DUF262 domain-containing protein n=1 Tax=Bradyrhizobium liaoningense TaxID=43992 RepID=UPI00054FEF4F|nr:DUF262 domain-containing protein [Bradyrhizobium liaoningense]